MTRFPDAIGNPFLRPRLGACQFEFGNLDPAANKLVRVNTGGAAQSFGRRGRQVPAISDYASARHQHALMFVPVTQSDAETLVAIGAAVLREIFAKADEHRMPVRVCALRGSDANRFYARHGFVRTGEAEWDIDYRREPGAATT